MSQLSLKTEKHDNHTIITAVHQLIPDPAATHQHCEPLVEAEPKAAEVRQKKKDMLDKNRRAEQIINKSRILWTNFATMQRKMELTPEEKLQKDRLDADWKTVNVEMGETQLELRGLAAELDVARCNHRRHNPVFGVPAQGCFIDRGLKIVGPDESGFPKIMNETELEAVQIKDENGEITGSYSVFLPGVQTISDIMALWMGKAEHEACTIEGECIPDHRGLVYHCKTGETWGKRTIVALGEFPGATEKEFKQLTEAEQAEIDAQNENERVSALSDVDRLAEYESKAAVLLEKCALDKTKLELGGMTAAAALTKAKADYNAELDILKTKYGVTI